MENKVTIIELIRRGRKLSTTQLALISGLSRRTLFSIQKKGHIPKKKTMDKIAKALGVDPRIIYIDYENGGNEK